MDIRCSRGPDVFELPEWRKIHDTDPHRNLFSLPEWHRCWWEEFGSNKELFVLTFLDPEPVAIASLVLDRYEGESRLRFLGGEDLTDYLGPAAVDHERLPKVADALLSYALDEIGGWDVFDARCLPVPFHFSEWLVDASHRAGLKIEIDEDEITAVVQLPESFEAYQQSLPNRQRHELRRKLRRFEREAPGALIHTATSESLTSDVLRFIDMHRLNEGPKGKFFGPQRETFFARIAQTFQDMGTLRLQFMEHEGRQLAATFSFEYQGTFYLYNSAFDPQYRPIAPGFILVARLIEEAIAKGLDRFDMLRGRERYKFDLGAEQLPLNRIRLRR